MTTKTDVHGVLRCLLADVGLPDDPVRDPMRAWAHPGLPRLRFPGVISVVFKYADAPLDREYLALRLAERHGVPVPYVQAACAEAGVLAMLMDALGKPVREPNDFDGVCAAARLHRVGGAVWLPRVTSAVLAGTPHRIGIRLKRLGRPGPDDGSRSLEAAAPRPAAGGGLPAFGR